MRSRTAIERLGGPVIRAHRRVRLIDGYYRLRRGQLVRIPDKWVGVVAHPQTIRKRPSKEPRKSRRRGDRPVRAPNRMPKERYQRIKTRRPATKMGHPRNRSPRHQRKRQRDDRP